MLKPKIEFFPKKRVVGKSLRMSLVQNKTHELWQSFMPLRNTVKNKVGTDFYSIQVYDNVSYFENFDPKIEFTKWAGIETTENDSLPENLETLELDEGLYAIFQHKGSSTDTSIFQYIFATWLPVSDYELDHRPHFEILGEKYKNQDPNSEEQICIPVKPKKNILNYKNQQP
ncbi:GyrI-like domain-containing protein [uncultured Kriegella sp.]|uniref:GyrI-like domain-containing protein n=1 Tax=uncultured Kriegella sp. TaxID=1798910 RepID=UPI0030DAB699